jgi:AraC-like DNA-binding protein
MGTLLPNTMLVHRRGHEVGPSQLLMMKSSTREQVLEWSMKPSSRLISTDHLEELVVGELLAAAPNLPRQPSREQFIDALNCYLNRYARGNIDVLARLLKIPAQRLHRYLQGNVPFFDGLLQLCYSMSITPLEFLTTNFISSQDTPQSILERIPVLSSGKRKPVMDGDVQRMRQALEAVLEVEEDPFPFLTQVAQRLGYHINTLRKHCPDLCQSIIARQRQSWASNNARTEMRLALENALMSDKRLPLEAVAQQLGCTRSRLYEHFPDLSRSVAARYRDRFDRERIQEQLHNVLSSSEEPPGIRELAQQLDCKYYVLEDNFPDLCKQIVLRRSEERRKRREERVAQTYIDIHQTMMVFHQQGIYPSSSRVTKQLNKPYILWTKEGYEAWLLTLEELGYPTDHLKKRYVL